MGATRREVVVGGGTLAALAASGIAQAASPAVRYNALSPQGRQMLAKYATAVDIMKHKIPANDPRNWNFQWFTHWVPGPDPMSNWEGSASIRAAFLDQTFGTASSPARQLAEEMWNSCQSHGKDPNNPSAFAITYFLPWHRWFVYYFERIVQGVLKDSSFTLPYWNYLGTSPADKIIPPEFRDSASPLYVPIRNGWVNGGQPIDQQNPNTLNFGASRFPYYVDAAGQTGFCPQLNQNPHGLVHDYTGDVNDMGYVPTAGQDPIFWLHHSNIDRLWASWNAAGFKNPTWSQRLFTFADGDGKRVQADPNGASSISQLNYSYDSLQPVERVIATGAKALQAARPATSLSGPVQLSRTAPASVALQPAAAADAADAHKMLGATPDNAPGVFLVLSGIELPVPVNGTYNIFLNLPAGAPTTPDSPYYVGTFGSFEIMNHSAGDHDGGGMLVFDASRAVASQSASGAAAGSPQVTFVPVGSIRVAPTVASVALITH